MNGLPDCRLLSDRAHTVRLLTERGLSPIAAEQKAALLAKAAGSLAALLGGEGGPISAWFVPGRIEVLGKHTDYAGGRSMIAAAERGFCLVFCPRQDDQVNVIDALSGEKVGFPLHPGLTPQAGHWSNYPMTVARRIARNFPNARQGAEIAFASDLPPAAGMSSSSALIVAMFLALAEVNRLRSSPECRGLFENLIDLAGYLGCVENGQSFGTFAGDRGVGTFGGSEDHTAILLARPSHVAVYSYCPVRFEQAIAVPADHLFAIGVSGVVAEKTGAALEKYNRASRLAAAVAELWRRGTGREDPHLAAALDTAFYAVAHLAQIVEDAPAEFSAAELLSRLEHFTSESNLIVPGAAEALQGGDLARFGSWVDCSQRVAEEHLGNQVPETSHLAASARRLGAVAASAFGAGFGGSVWALVRAAESEAFMQAWAEQYYAKFPQHAQSSMFFTTAAGPAAFRVG